MDMDDQTHPSAVAPKSTVESSPLPFPIPSNFAVVRMDPVAMVRRLKLDQLAIAEAEAMRPQKYLVYLTIVSVHS